MVGSSCGAPLIQGVGVPVGVVKEAAGPHTATCMGTEYGMVVVVVADGLEVLEAQGMVP